MSTFKFLSSGRSGFGMHRRNLGLLIGFHCCSLIILVFQCPDVSSSFSGATSPYLFYAVVIFAMGALTLVMFAFRPRRARGSPKVACRVNVLPYCQTCREFMWPRTFHCGVCGCCIPGQVGHVATTGCCVDFASLLAVAAGFGAEALYCLGIVVLSARSSLFDMFTKRIGLTLIAAPSAALMLQSIIFFVQFTQAMFTSAIFLESKRWGWFEYFVIQQRKRNPYDKGLIDNMALVGAPPSSFSWPSLPGGPETDQYFEDVSRFRGLDLRPTVLPDDQVPSLAHE
jgi:hypothetical protein